MRVNVLILVLTLLGLCASASAEKVKTNQSAKLYSRPGEQATVLLKVKSGQNMTVLAKEGRWLKVRVQGRTGYVPRSKVDMPDDDEIVRNTRRRPFVDGRSTKRGFGGAEGPDDRVGADATGEGADDKGDDDDDGGGKGKKHATDDDGGRGKKHASDDDDGGKGKKHAADDDGGGKGKKHAADDDGGGKGKKHAADDDDDGGKGKKHAADDDGGGKGKKHAADDDDDGGKGKKHAADDDDGDKGKKHGDDEEDTTVVDDDKTEEPKVDERPMAHVTEKTKVLSERDADSDAQFTAKPSDVLFPTDTKGPWTFVENEEGDGGWVMTSMLDMDGGGGGPRKRAIDLRARLGVSFLQQGMRTVGSTGQEPDNYNISTSAFTLAIGGGILVPRGKKWLIGGDLSYNFEKAIPGIAYQPMGGTATSIGITVHQLDLRAVGGIDLHKKNGMMVLGRLGYRYQGFLIDNVADTTKNPAPLRLPSEVFKAPTLGVALGIPRLTDKVGLRFALDAVLFGASITQTQGLEDGTSPSASAYCFGGVFTYRWKSGMDLQGTYDLNYTSYDFGAPSTTSMRVHTGTDVKRTDIFHTVTFGITKGF